MIDNTVLYFKTQCESSEDDHSNTSDGKMESNSNSQMHLVTAAERHDLKKRDEIIASQDNFELAVIGVRRTISHQQAKISLGLKKFFQKIPKMKIYQKLFESEEKQLNLLERSKNGKKSDDENSKYIPVENETLEKFLESVNIKNPLSQMDPKICDSLVTKVSTVLNLLTSILSICINPNIEIIVSRFLKFQHRLKEVVITEAILARFEHIEESLKQLLSVFMKLDQLNKAINCSTLSHYFNHLKNQEKTLTQAVNNSYSNDDSQRVFLQILNDTLEELIAFIPYANNILDKAVELSALNLNISGNSLSYKESSGRYKLMPMSTDTVVNSGDNNDHCIGKTQSLSLEETVLPNKDASTTQTDNIASNLEIRNPNKLQESDQIVTSSREDLEGTLSVKVKPCSILHYEPHPSLTPDLCKIKNCKDEKLYNPNSEMKENMESGKENSSVRDGREFSTMPGHYFSDNVTSVLLMPCFIKSHTLTISKKSLLETDYRINQIEGKLDQVIINSYKSCSEEDDIPRYKTVEMEIVSDDDKSPNKTLETDRIIMVLPFKPEIVNQNPVMYYRNLSGNPLEGSNNKIMLKPSLEVVDHICNQNHEETSLEEYLTAVRELITLYEKMKPYQEAKECMSSLVVPLIPIKSSE